MEPNLVRSGALCRRWIRNTRYGSVSNLVLTCLITVHGTYFLSPATALLLLKFFSHLRLVLGKAVNREDKRSRRYRDRHFAKFESSRRYRDR